MTGHFQLGLTYIIFTWLHTELILGAQLSCSFLKQNHLLLLLKKISGITDSHYLPSRDNAGLVDVCRCSLSVLPSSLLCPPQGEWRYLSSCSSFSIVFWFQNSMFFSPIHFPFVNQNFPLLFQSNLSIHQLHRQTVLLRTFYISVELVKRSWYINLKLSCNSSWRSFIKYMVDLEKQVGTCRLCNSNSFIARMLGSLTMTSFPLNVGFTHGVAWLFSENRDKSHINVSSFL